MTRIVPAALTVLVLAGCTPSQAPPELSPEDPNQESVRWIPNPSVDLMSAEGTFIRATVESWRRAQSARAKGVDAVRERGYPGFDHAYNNSFGLIDSTGGHPDQVGVGTQYSEVVGLRRDGDRISADVCEYFSQTATKQQDGRYYSRGSLPHGQAATFTFGPDPKLPADQQHRPLANQRGPSRTPSDDVFGTWVLFKIGSPEDKSISERCRQLAPGTPEGLPDPYERPDPPPTLPPDPGWPAGSSA